MAGRPGIGHAGMNWERQSSVKRFKSSTCFLDGPVTFNVATDRVLHLEVTRCPGSYRLARTFRALQGCLRSARLGYSLWFKFESKKKPTGKTKDDLRMNEIEKFERTVLLIDGSHMERLRTKLGRMLDLEKLRDSFSDVDELALSIFYRDAHDTGEYQRLSRFFEWLDRHDFERRGAQDFNEAWYQRERYGSNLVELAADAMHLAHQGVALAILAGDAKLIPLFERLEEMDVPVTLISSLAVPASIAPPPPLVELAEEFIDLNEDERFFFADD